MSRCICLYLSVAVSLFCAPACYGQTTVWLSDNATYSDLDITTAAPPGTTRSFDIWIKNEHLNRLNNISLDLMTMGDAIEFTGAEIVIGRNRFELQGNPMVVDAGRIVTDMDAYAGIGGADLGTGIGLNVPADNEELGGYRFARIRYRITGVGISDLRLKVGEFLFGWNTDGPNTIHLGIDDPISENVPGGTDTIIDGRIQVVPEPGSLSFLLIGTMLLSKRCV